MEKKKEKSCLHKVKRNTVCIILESKSRKEKHIQVGPQKIEK